MDSPTRRSLLGAGVTMFASLAGCSSDTAQRRTGTGGSGTDTRDLDRREANVTDVAVESRNDGDYRFDVTLYHDDSGEDGYANWWQVETLDGGQLGRRELSHAHGTEPFTRSETIAVPDGVGCVVVRGHDQTHGYGGQAMAVSVPNGETNAVSQESERQPVGENDCP